MNKKNYPTNECKCGNEKFERSKQCQECHKKGTRGKLSNKRGSGRLPILVRYF